MYTFDQETKKGVGHKGDNDLHHTLCLQIDTHITGFIDGQGFAIETNFTHYNTY